MIITRRSKKIEIGPSYLAINEFLGGEEVEVRTGVVKYAIPADFDGKNLKSIIAVCDSAPAGAPIIGNVIKNGASLVGSQFTIPEGQQQSATVQFTGPVNTGDVISIGVTQIGSTQPGTMLTVTIGLDD